MPWRGRRLVFIPRKGSLKPRANDLRSAHDGLCFIRFSVKFSRANNMPKPPLPLALEAFELGRPFFRQPTGYPRDLATGPNVNPKCSPILGSIVVGKRFLRFLSLGFRN